MFFKLSEKTTLNITLNKYGKVSADIARVKDNTVRKLYLHENEMRAFLMLIPQINRIAVSDGEDGDVRIRLSGVKYATVSQFRGQKYIGVHTYKDGLRVAGRCMNLSIEEWDKLM
jgi:hypothetical protein